METTNGRGITRQASGAYLSRTLDISPHTWSFAYPTKTWLPNTIATPHACRHDFGLKLTANARRRAAHTNALSRGHAFMCALSGANTVELHPQAWKQQSLACIFPHLRYVRSRRGSEEILNRTSFLFSIIFKSGCQRFENISFCSRGHRCKIRSTRLLRQG